MAQVMNEHCMRFAGQLHTVSQTWDEYQLTVTISPPSKPLAKRLSQLLTPTNQLMLIFNEGAWEFQQGAEGDAVNRAP